MTAVADPATPIRWGFIGAGGIAHKLATDIALTDGNVVVAVAARDAGRAADFARRHKVERSYGSYEQLVADENVDVVYVATTHPGHKAQSLMAIEAGRSLLIEKPVCLNAADAREVFRAADAAGVFAMEAMWMRCNPLVLRAEQLIAEGAIGEVCGVRFEFGLGRRFDPGDRLFEMANGGGALLDLGIYPVSFAWHFLGCPDEVRTVGTLSPTGSDDTVAMQWVYAGVPRAQLWCSATVLAPNEAAILGTDGWIRFEPMAHRPTGLVVCRGESQDRIADPIEGQGYGYCPQVLEVERCLRAGLTESPLVPPADTVAILELLDEARASLGVVYPGET
ncbi:MAG: Gfo/Idh/MocA family oxidoreductase [Actinobacteria bacterium]|nr:Gfo/Idh/MocA family oxidoreductase [Actinomycetota bacterium]